MPVHRRLAFRLTGLVTLLVLATIVFIGVLNFQRSRAELTDWFGIALERIVATAALEIDGDAHRRIRTLADTKGDDFIRIRDQLRRVQRTNYLREDLVYTVHIDPQLKATAAVMLQATPYTGDAYTVQPSNREAIRRTLRDKQACHTVTGLGAA